MEKSKIDQSDDENENPISLIGSQIGTTDADHVQLPPLDSGKKPKESARHKANLNNKVKKNKYFFLAHPEYKSKVDVTTIGEKFVVDKEKVEKIKSLIKANEPNGKSSNGSKTKKYDKKADGYSSIWQIERCDSSEDDDESSTKSETEKKKKMKKKKAEFDLMLNENLNIQKQSETLDDGTLVETIRMIADDEPDLSEPDDMKPVKKKQKKTNKPEKAQKTSNQSDAEVQLQSSRFRFLNELLYTKPSDDSFEYFQKYGQTTSLNCILSTDRLKFFPLLFEEIQTHLPHIIGVSKIKP